MRILKCHITNFGCYIDQTFDFSTKLNTFFLKNGEGKTTLATFIKSMFYSLEKSSKNSYERKHYKPYSGGEYGGSLEFELNGKKYRIERTFADSMTKDTLKIFDENGVKQNSFLNKQIVELQGENSSMLGEMIFGIDAASFQRCNFISSNDLDFSNSESIKMKIGNIVIDRDKENSYQETYDSIVDFDLRDKKPTTSKNENAYPYKIKELEKENKNKKDEINELNKLESSLQELYEIRDKIKTDINEIELKQKDFSKMHELKGKMAVVHNFDKDIEEKNNIINNIYDKYNGNIPSKDELDYLDNNISKYDKCLTLDDNYIIQASDIEKLKELDGKVINDDDYSAMVEANSILSNSENKVGVVNIDLDKYEELKARFDGKSLKNDGELENEYIKYKAALSQVDISSTNKEYPSENVLLEIDNEIKEYNERKKELEDFKLGYKEPSLFIKILLMIITFGIYFFVLKKKKKDYQEAINKKEEKVAEIAKLLNDFFGKYGKIIGSYEFKLLELKDEIKNGKKHEEALKNLDLMKSTLINYFSFFGYMAEDVEVVYKLYKDDLSIYNDILKDYDRNKKINEEVQNIKRKQLEKIDDILNKYSIRRREDFVTQLNDIKLDIDFYKENNPIYTNKLANLNEKTKYEENIIKILNLYNVNYKDNDIVICAKKLKEDILRYDELKNKKAELIENREKFIKDNDLTGFVVEDVLGDEEKLREEYQLKNAELERKEDEINQIELKISIRDSLNDDINNNIDLINEYKEKIKIAEYAKKALEEAQSEMEAKFIGPIKDSFVTYAKQIYEKIALNINMNYDYEIKYDVKGKLRDAADLSDGERTIMMLALRFAVLDSMYKNHDSIIILDDPFESLDDEKLSKAKELIKALADEWQIIYFTCHESRRIN